MLNLTNIEARIKAHLTSIGDFQVVYDYHTLTPSWYPYASFELTHFDGNPLDNCTDEVVLEFGILVYQETTSLGGRSVAKVKLYTILEKIIKTFRADATLSWSVVDLNFLRWELWTYDGKEGDVMFLQVFLQVKTTLFFND